MKNWLWIMVAIVGVAACSEQNDNQQQAANNGSQAVIEEAETTNSQKVLDDARSQMPAYESGTVVITTKAGESHNFDVELAITGEQQAYGLMYRKTIPDNTGMLFIWDEPHPVEFWMRNTLVTLDMLFIDENHDIISIEHNATPRSDDHIQSNGDVIAVLEIMGGTANRLGIAVGDKVTWTKDTEDSSVPDESVQPEQTAPQDNAPAIDTPDTNKN